MVTIANLTADAAGLKNLTADAEGKKNLTANYAPLVYNEDMTVTRDTTDRWTFAWDTADAPFNIYLEGEFKAVTEDASYSIVSETEPALEVYDADVTDEAYTVVNRPSAEVVWYSPDPQSYLVERYIDPSWRRQGRPISNAGIGYYSILTGYLGDDLEEEWRVTPRNEWETEGTPVEEDFTVVSHPAPPVYSASITGGNLIIGSV